ncbi:YdcF family protein [Companilactobacillus furfuricola]|uniref:YdcF family protein n=1 Tax=Companilactobacillus furfuricola TaxID=1462575 RepID=UPI000F7B2F99|nr:YdcF family protein [Companilactobacillus furfuricola]
MRQYLLDHGIPDSDIIVENRSENTAQNLEFSSITIKRHWKGSSLPHIVVVTSEFHIPRVQQYATRLGLDANFVPSITIPVFKWPAMFREFTAIIWYHRYTIETIMLMMIVLLICTFVR